MTSYIVLFILKLRFSKRKSLKPLIRNENKVEISKNDRILLEKLGNTLYSYNDKCIAKGFRIT